MLESGKTQDTLIIPRWVSIQCWHFHEINYAGFLVCICFHTLLKRNFIKRLNTSTPYWSRLILNITGRRLWVGFILFPLICSLWMISPRGIFGVLVFPWNICHGPARTPLSNKNGSNSHLSFDKHISHAIRASTYVVARFHQRQNYVVTKVPVIVYPLFIFFLTTNLLYLVPVVRWVRVST